MIRLLFVLFSGLSLTVSSVAANDSSWTSPGFVQKFLNPAKDNGWILLRRDGAQDWIYFPTLLMARCALWKIQYSINSDALDRVFWPFGCDLNNPSALPSGLPLGDIAVSYGPPPIETVAVQAFFNDGTKSEVLVYSPCPDAGSQTCAMRIR